eukprot:gene16966-18675_t
MSKFSRIHDENLSPTMPQKTKPMSPFIAKLRLLLKQRKYWNAIHWSTDGRALVITDMETFKDQVLENDDEMFKTKNFASFVRQLNLYGFRKLQTTNARGDPTMNMHFEHPNFRRDRPDLIPLVQRTCNSTKRRLAGHFQDVYKPKKLRLDGGNDSLPLASPLTDKSNIQRDIPTGSAIVTNLFKAEKNIEMGIHKMAEAVSTTSIDEPSSELAQQKPTEHDYALPMCNPYHDEDIDERKVYKFLNKHFKDEVIVVQALLSMASQNHCKN